MPITIEQVLGCRTLPTLPTVAVEVLALTRDPNVPLDKIAAVIQNDPALTAKVLKTVNSSYYGLAQKCATLNRAIGFLGVKTVKSLVLGFCLVDSTRSVEGEGFDLSEYWRRGIYSATAARLIATATGATDPDEAFTACLFQDIGMLACFAAIGREYDALLTSAPLAHEGLSAFEKSEMGFDHCECGARFAEKWNLPTQHIETIRWHHSPDEADEAFRDLIRVVALSNLVAEVARAELPGQAAATLIVRTNDWFGNGALDAESLLNRVGDAANQLAKEFGKDLGSKYDAAAIMAEANDLLLETNLQGEREVVTLKQSAEELTKAATIDALTGAFNRKHFDQAVARAFDEAKRDPARAPLSVLFIDGDKFKSVNDTHGHAAGDAVLKELAKRFKASAPQGSMVCRYGGEEFAVILPGHDLERGASAAEKVRAEIAREPFSLAGTGAKTPTLAVTVSVGVAAVDGTKMYADAQALVHAADEAVYAAKKNGRNRVERAGAVIAAAAAPGLGLLPEVSTIAPSKVPTAASPAPIAVPVPAPTLAPTPAPTPAPVPTAQAATLAANRSGKVEVLLVEDDPLAGRLLMTLLGKRPNTNVRHVRSAEEALPILGGPASSLPNLVITDLRLRAMNGAQLIASARANPKTRALPMIVLSASDNPEDESECMRAGANFYLHKEAIVTDLNRTLARIMSAAA
ncbi:MAG: HDOD domain-containing protein [Phycisphaerales bacterium]